MKLLVTSWQSVFVLDLKNETIRHLHKGSGSYYGISWNKNRLFVAARFGYDDVTEHSTERILVFNKKLKFVGYLKEADESKIGVHSIQVDPKYNKLWITATGKNKIKIVDLNTNKCSDFFPNQKKNVDWNHFNSVTLNGNYMMVNAHNGRNKIDYGQVFFCTRQKPTTSFVVAMPKSGQTHNCFLYKGELHTCASMRGQVTDFKGKDRLPTKWKGYTRGIAVTSKQLFVGESKRSERFFRKDADGWIHVYNRRRNRLTHRKTIHLPKFGQVLAIRVLDHPDHHHQVPPFL